jgi:hypothetical protein
MNEQAMVPVPDNRITFGQTHLDPSDIVVPRVKVLQAMSAEVTDVEGAKVGDFYNTLTNELYGARLAFVPLMPFKQRILLVRAERRDRIEAALGAEISEGDGLKCRSFDMVHGQGEPGILCEQCPLSVWVGNVPPLCTETYNLAATSETGELIVLSFSKSGARTGKQLFSALRLTPVVPWTYLYSLTSKMVQNDQGRFAVPTFKREGATTSEQRDQALYWARQLDGMTLNVAPDVAVDESAEEPPTDDAPPPWEETPTPARRRK